MFNKRKNKTFNYNSRFYKDEIKEINSEYKSKEDVALKWRRTRKTGAGKRRIGLPLLLLLLGIIVAAWYYLEYKL